MKGVFLAGHTVSLGSCFVMNIITCSPMIWQSCHTMIAAKLIYRGYNDLEKSKYRKLFWANIMNKDLYELTPCILTSMHGHELNSLMNLF